MESVIQRSAVQLQQGDELISVAREVTSEKMVEFERVVWDRGSNAHSDPEAAKSDGLSRPLASGQNQMAFIHEMLELNFGDSWVYGGRISVRYIHPVYEGDRITVRGFVTEIAESNGLPRLALTIWCENQDGQKTAAGMAYAGQPSALRSWLGESVENVK
jgi:acyl dehydratase